MVGGVWCYCGVVVFGLFGGGVYFYLISVGSFLLGVVYI